MLSFALLTAIYLRDFCFVLIRVSDFVLISYSYTSSITLL